MFALPCACDLLLQCLHLPSLSYIADVALTSFLACPCVYVQQEKEAKSSGATPVAEPKGEKVERCVVMLRVNKSIFEVRCSERQRDIASCNAKLWTHVSPFYFLNVGMQNACI